MRRQKCSPYKCNFFVSVFDVEKKPERTSSRGLQGLSSDTKIVTFCDFRELAFQISEQFEALGSNIGVKCGEYFIPI